MFKFDKSLIRFEYVKIKSISTALGGSIRILDEENSTEDKQETIRYSLPYAVACKFRKRNKAISFWMPVSGVIVWYDNQIVYVEKRKDSKASTEGTEQEWMSVSELNFKRYVESIIDASPDSWFTDGTFIYRLPDNINQAIKESINLTRSGLFKGLSVDVLKFANLDQTNLIQNTETRSIVVSNLTKDQFIMTPPIWKNVFNIRKTSVDVTEEEKKNQAGRFDTIDEYFSVNLEFALNAGRTIGKVFGYDHVSPLRLDELMIHLNTVNLPKVSKSVRATFDIGLPFLQAFAWVVGLLAKCDNMSDLIEMRALLKQLCTKGIFRTDTLSNIYKQDSSHEIPELKEREQALTEASTLLTGNRYREYWGEKDRNKDKKGIPAYNATGMSVED